MSNAAPDLVKKKPFHEEFEDEIRELLKGLGFKDVRGGALFKIGPVQIDASGGHEDTLLIVECTAAIGKLKANLREKMKALRGVQAQIESAAKTDNLFSKYKNFVYILATNVEVRDADREFAALKPVIHLWDKQVYEYYDDLRSSIGEFAKFNLLGELGVEPLVRTYFQSPAFRIHAGQTELYEFFVDAKRLLTVSYVARREVGQDSYYQRMVKKGRLARIASYIKDEKRIFPNSLVVAFVKEPKFTPLTDLLEQSKQEELWPKWIELGVLQFPSSYRSCWIVDGQHRLYGLAQLPDTKIPVTAFGRLSPEDQAKYFLDINGEQRRVPADLIWDLSGELTPTKESGIISNIVKKLDSEGPLASRIYVPLHGSKKGRPIKIASVCEAIRRVGVVRDHSVNMRGGEKNPLKASTPEETVRVVSRAISEFMTLVQQTFPQITGKADFLAEFFFDNTGIGLLVFLFERLTVSLGRVPTSNDGAPYLAALRNYMENTYPRSNDIRDLRKACVGESGRGLVADEFSSQINERLPSTMKGLPLSRLAEEVDREYKDIERNLRGLVGRVLRRASKRNWVKERVPPEMAKKLESKRTSAETPLWDYLTLGECKTLILHGGNWPLFKDIFVGSEAGFSSQEMFSESFQLFMDKGRNPQIHSRAAGTKYGDIELLRGIKKKLQACIDAWARSLTSGQETEDN